MDLDLVLLRLYDKDTMQAFEYLKELELLSDESDVLYPLINNFIEMISSEKYIIKVRGFRLCYRQAKWDTENIINDNIEKILTILNDDKPTAVRLALAALHDLTIYKKELNSIIKNKVQAINFLRYKDTMHGLIANDIQKVLKTL